jgi:hypothetical protein
LCVRKRAYNERFHPARISDSYSGGQSSDVRVYGRCSGGQRGSIRYGFSRCGVSRRDGSRVVVINVVVGDKKAATSFSLFDIFEGLEKETKEK